MCRYSKGKVVCNQCGRELSMENGIVKEGRFSVDFVFGYFSNKDGERHQFDLCENCYDKMVERFSIPVTIMEETELFGNL